MPYCSKCGHNIPSNVRFCTACGAPVNGSGQNNLYQRPHHLLLLLLQLHLLLLLLLQLHLLLPHRVVSQGRTVCR